MGNHNPSRSGFDLIISSNRLKHTRSWLGSTKWDRKTLEEMATKKEVAPFERPLIIENETELSEEEISMFEQCPLCLLHFRRGLNECVNCGEKVCSHCYFRAKSPPFRAPFPMKNETGEEIIKKGEFVDDSECIICRRNPWSVVYIENIESEKKKKVGEVSEVSGRKKLFKDQQQKALEYFQNLLDERKKKQKKSTKKKKMKKKSVSKEEARAKKKEESDIKDIKSSETEGKENDENDDENEKDVKVDDEEEWIKQFDKMVPSTLEIDDIVEAEAKLIEAALEHEMEETGTVPELDSEEYNKMKTTCSIALFGTIKRLKVAELKRTVLFEKKKCGNIEKEEVKSIDFDRKGFDDGFFDFLL